MLEKKRHQPLRLGGMYHHNMIDSQPIAVDGSVGHWLTLIVEDDFGPKLGRVYWQTDSAQADRETTLSDLYSGQYHDPVRVVAFNTSEGWSRDVSHEFAEELQRRADLDHVELTGTLKEFVEFYTRPELAVADSWPKARYCGCWYG
jgi:hypothetical protein